MKRFIVLALSGIMMMSLFVGFAQSAPSAWKPEREVEFVVPSAPGGGSDLNARTIADLAQRNKFSPYALMVVNKAGGSGAVAFSYVNSKKGDPYTLMVLHSGQAIGSYVNNWSVKCGDLTYIATLALDNLLIAVNADSPYKDIKSLLQAVKEKPESIKIGGSQYGNTAHLCYLLLNKYTKSKFTYVMFNSDGEVMAALLGKHIDVGIFTPSSSFGQVAGGRILPVATFAQERLTGLFKDVPTFTELGYKKIKVTAIRAISGPPKMPAAAVKFYEEMLKKITETEEWKKDYLEKNLLTGYYLNAADTKKFHEEQIKLYTKTFKEVGFIK